MTGSDASDAIAERMLLGITLAAPEQAAAVFLALPPDVWTDPRHTQIAAVLTDRFRRDIPIEPEGVSRAVVGRAGTDHVAQQLAQLVVTLATNPAPVAALPWYAEKVCALATVRRVHGRAATFQAQVERAGELDDDELFRSAVTSMREACDDALVSFAALSTEPPMSLAELLTGTDEYDWLVPGLLERTDRMIVTGSEGLGKSYFGCQWGCTIGAGLHPFTGKPLAYRPDGYRVLVVDCENSRRQLRRRYRWVAEQISGLAAEHDMAPPDWGSVVRFVVRPEGVSLTDPRELARMEQAVAAAAPDLLVIGPMYRLSRVDIRDEQAAKELTDTIDMLRVRHNMAVMCETHAGHARDGSGTRQLRPLGSSLFLRWPEFGVGLRAHPDHAHEEHPSVVEVSSWRGARDERHWPRRLRHGRRLPWEPDDPEYWDRPPLRSVS